MGLLRRVYRCGTSGGAGDDGGVGSESRGVLGMWVRVGVVVADLRPVRRALPP